MYQTEFLFFLSFPGGDKLPRTPYCVENKPVKHMVNSPTRVQKKSMNQPSSTGQLSENIGGQPLLQTNRKSMIPVPTKREIATQTGGILTVRQKSTLNYIPKGVNQLRRSAKDRKRQDSTNNTPTKKENSIEIDIEVKNNNNKLVSRVNLSGTEISLRITPEKSNEYRRNVSQTQDFGKNVTVKSVVHSPNRVKKNSINQSSTIEAKSRKIGASPLLHTNRKSISTLRHEQVKESNPPPFRSRIQRLSNRLSMTRKSTSSPTKNVQKNIQSKKEIGSNVSEEKCFKSILETKTLQPVKTTNLGVLLVLVDK